MEKLFSLFIERAKRVAVKQEDAEKKDEEEWMLRDVIFIEDVKSVPVGEFYLFIYNFSHQKIDVLC